MKGLYALIGCTISIFLPGSLVFGFPGLMGPVWKQMLEIESGALNYILFFLLASLGIFMFFVGKWTATVGVRRLIVMGTIITSLATFMVAFVSHFIMIYIWAFGVGAASCFIYSPAINCVQRWYPQKRGMVSGIVNMTFGISAAIMVPFYRLMLDTVGYQQLCIGVSIGVMVIGLIASRNAELPGFGSEESNSSTKASNNIALAIDESVPPREAVKTKNFWMLWLVWAFMGAAGVSMITLSVNFGLSRGFSLAVAVSILTAFNLTNGISRILSGAISDVIGRRITLSITFLGATIAYLLLPRAESIVLISALAAVVGFSYGTLFSVSAPMISDCFGLKHFGIILGLVFTAYGFVASVLGPAVSGYILEFSSGDYQMVFSYLAVLSLISAVLILNVKVPHQKLIHKPMKHEA